MDIFEALSILESKEDQIAQKLLDDIDEGLNKKFIQQFNLKGVDYYDGLITVFADDKNGVVLAEFDPGTWSWPEEYTKDEVVRFMAKNGFKYNGTRGHQNIDGDWIDNMQFSKIK